MRDCAVAPSRTICEPETYAPAGLARNNAAFIYFIRGCTDPQSNVDVPTPAMSFGWPIRPDEGFVRCCNS